MTVGIDDVLHLVDQLPGVEHVDARDYTSFKVKGNGFGYLWSRTKTVGLKQPLAEQIALVAERPDVFEVQFTAGQFGWVVVHLTKIEFAELRELVVEAWLLSAPRSLVDQHEERLLEWTSSNVDHHGGNSA